MRPLMDRAPLRRSVARLALLLAAYGLPHLANAQGDSLPEEESPVGILELEGPHLRLFYPPNLAHLAPTVAGAFINAVDSQQRRTGWVPSDRLNIQLQDWSDTGNGAAYAVPPWITIEASPIASPFETWPYAERTFNVVNHELVHAFTFDAASDSERLWRRLLNGKVQAIRDNPETILYSYLTVPGFTSPRWYTEGGASFMETWMAGGIGRAQGGYGEMVFRAKIRDGAALYDPLGLVSRGTRVDFQTETNSYLYGTRFFTWLALTYSPEQALSWYEREPDSARNWAARFREIFGVTVESAWQSWLAFEQRFQQDNLARLKQYPVTAHQTLSARALGSVSRIYFDEDTRTMLGGFLFPGAVEHVGALSVSDGSLRELAPIKRAAKFRVTAFAYDPRSRTAFFTNDNVGFLSFRDLMSVNVETGEVRSLFVNARVGELVVHPVDQNLYGVRIENGAAALVRLPPPYDTWYRVYQFPDGTVPGDLDISPDGKLLSASVSEVGGRQFLRIWSLERVLAGDITPLSQFDFGQALPESFVFSPDGRYLFGSSYYTGVSNIFRYEVATGAVEAVTNADTGYFRPLPLKDGRLLALTYGAEGFTPVMLDPKPLQDVSAIRFLGAELVERHPDILGWQVPPPATADVAGLTRIRGPYHPARRLELSNAYPVLQGYKDQMGVGYRLNWNDPENFASAALTTAWTPGGDLSGSEQAHVDLSARYLFWRASVSWNRSDFYDLFGPTERSRKGLAIKLGHERRLLDDEPRLLRLTWDLAHYDDIDTLPGAQTVGTDFTRLTTAEVGLRYTDLKRSLGAIDDERGVTASLVAYGSAANSQWVPQWIGTFDIGRPLPVPNTSVWLRSAAGAAYGDPEDPLANFYFGGFGNNWVDNGLVPRYRNFDALPGFEINERQALRFVREMVEVNLPPVFFESLGRPDFHLSSLRPAVFVAGLWTDPDRGTSEARLGSVGVQADLGFRILHWYDMTLSAGFAWGFEGRDFAGTEFMLSLKIL